MTSNPKSTGESDVSSNEMRSCNGVALALLIAASLFGYIGFRYGASYGVPGYLLGTVVGIVVGFLATPLVFVLLMAFIHVAIRIEEFFNSFNE